MRRSKISLRSGFLVLLMALAALAQTATEMDSPEVLRVAGKLKCSCGCNQSMACVMPPGCPLCRMNKAKIYNMQKVGMSDAAIIGRFQKESGPDVVIIPPGIGGTVAPYIALALGLGLVLWTIRRYAVKKPITAAAGTSTDIDPAILERIEKDLSKLE